MLEVWDTTFWTSAKTIDVHLGWLRRKLGDDTRRPTLITTIRGRGLRFELGPPAYERVPGHLTPPGTPWLPSGRDVPGPAPPRRVAVIGGGQLARMMAQAAVGARGAAPAARRGARASPPRRSSPTTSSATTATSTRCAR